MKKTEHCDSCGNDYPRDQLIEFDDQLLCPDCFQSGTLVCSRCGERIWKDENAGDADTPLCQSCYDRAYISCVHCGRIIREEEARYEDENDDEPYCSDCYDQHCRTHVIEDYYYKPDPVNANSILQFSAG